MTRKVNAILSGQSGVALLAHAGELASLHAGHGTEVVRRQPSEARFLLGDATDLQVLESVEIEEVSQRLDLATAQMDALHVALILLDGSLSADTRQEAAAELQEFMEDESVAVYVESVLFAHPLPADADLPGAFAACTQGTELTRSFLQNLASLQGQITEVYIAWESILTKVFGTAEERMKARSVAAREGFFRELVLQQRPARTSVYEFLLDVLCDRPESLLERPRLASPSEGAEEGAAVEHSIQSSSLERFAARTASREESRAITRHLLQGCPICAQRLRNLFRPSVEMVEEVVERALEHQQVLERQQDLVESSLKAFERPEGLRAKLDRLNRELQKAND